MNPFVRTAVIILGLAATVYVVVAYYPYIFAKTVTGEIVDVARVTDPTAVIGGGNLTAAQMHSYAIAVRDSEDGTIYTASTEDRKWAVARKGFCAKVTLYPYPPWQLGKGGDYFNARYDNLRDCNNLLGKGADTLAIPQSAPENAGTVAPTEAPGATQTAPAPTP